jgi:hypothetical protein
MRAAHVTSQRYATAGRDQAGAVSRLNPTRELDQSDGPLSQQASRLNGKRDCPQAGASQIHPTRVIDESRLEAKRILRQAGAVTPDHFIALDASQLDRDRISGQAGASPLNRSRETPQAGAAENTAFRPRRASVGRPSAPNRPSKAPSAHTRWTRAGRRGRCAPEGSWPVPARGSGSPRMPPPGVTHRASPVALSGDEVAA